MWSYHFFMTTTRLPNQVLRNHCFSLLTLPSNLLTYVTFQQVSCGAQILRLAKNYAYHYSCSNMTGKWVWNVLSSSRLFVQYQLYGKSPKESKVLFVPTHLASGHSVIIFFSTIATKKWLTCLFSWSYSIKHF